MTAMTKDEATVKEMVSAIVDLLRSNSVSVSGEFYNTIQRKVQSILLPPPKLEWSYSTTSTGAHWIARGQFDICLREDGFFTVYRWRCENWAEFSTHDKLSNAKMECHRHFNAEAAQ